MAARDNKKRASFTCLVIGSMLAIASSLVVLAPEEGHTRNETSQEIRILKIDGIINPLSARYFKREMGEATQDQVVAVVLELNTPGGLESSMREMVQTMLASTIPVVVYVEPQGARAASAGMFLTMAGHIAAMAPGTNIGAAHPVSLGGGEQGKTPDEPSSDVMTEKVVNDAAALARAIATERKRNGAWAEDAVRKSVSITAGEAVRKNVVDFVAKDQKDLLDQLEGKKVALPSGSIVLKTRQVDLVQRRMHLPERVLQIITDPNIAYLLITLGMIGVIAELYSPGLIFPGAIGVISLVFGFSAVGSLPLGWAGLILLVIGIGLLVLEFRDPGLGFFGAIGILAFVLGSLMLYSPISTPSPALPAVRVSFWLIGVLVCIFIAFVIGVIRAAVKAKEYPSAVGGAALIGSVGIALTDLAPKGTIKVNGEQWSAILLPGTENQKIAAGDQVEVTRSEGVVLQVKKRPVTELPNETD